MKVAAVYDVHGNLPALEAVLADLRRLEVDRIVVGGDVLPGPMAAECLALLRDEKIPVDFILGNGEVAALAERDGRPSGVPEAFRAGVRWSGERLSAEDAEWVASWPLTLRFVVGGVGEVLFCHATPRDLNEIFTVRTPESVLRTIFDAADASLVVCGHTHMQFDRQIGTTRVVNAGSVGMPFGGRGAYWLLVGESPELRHTSYDLAAAADRIRTGAYPGAAEFAAGNILDPPPAGVVLESYAKVELR
jgi:predicted phosphodiesterase